MNNLKGPESHLPLLFHFTETLDKPIAAVPFRYNTERKISEVYLDGAWIDAADACADINFTATRITKVDRETTDDE